MAKDKGDKYKIAGDRWLTEENVNVAIESYLGESENINAVDYNLQQLGVEGQGEQVVYGGAVSIAQMGEVFNVLFTQAHTVAAQQGVEAPSRYVVPVNVDVGGKNTHSGNHWALAVIEKDNEINAEGGAARPSISVQYIDPIRQAGVADENATNINMQLSQTFEVSNFENLSCGQQTNGWACGYITAENAVALASGNQPRPAYSNIESEQLFRKAQRTFQVQSGVSQPAVDPADLPPPPNDGDEIPLPQPVDEIGKSKFFPAVDRDGKPVDKSKWLTGEGLDIAATEALRRNKKVNAFDSDFAPNGKLDPSNPSVALSYPVHISNLSKTLEELRKKKDDVSAVQNLPDGVEPPNKYMIPLHVRNKGKLEGEGDHWVMAEITERSGKQGGKPNIGVRFADSAYNKGESPNLNHVEDQLSKKNNIVGDVEDLSCGQQPKGNGWGCGYIAAENASKMAADEPLKQQYTDKEMDDLYQRARGDIAKEEVGQDKDLLKQLRAVNRTIKSYQNAMDSNPGQVADISRAVKAMIYQGDDQPKGQKKGLFGRLDNMIDDFNLEKSSDVLYSAYSIIANTIGLLKDIFMVSTEAVLDNQKANRQMDRDFKNLVRKERLLKQTLLERKIDRDMNNGEVGQQQETDDSSVASSKSSERDEDSLSPMESLYSSIKPIRGMAKASGDEMDGITPPQTPTVTPDIVPPRTVVGKKGSKSQDEDLSKDDGFAAELTRKRSNSDHSHTKS